MEELEYFKISNVGRLEKEFVMDNENPIKMINE